MTLVTSSNTARIQSVDFLRGLVMVLMAIDHVRVYSGLPAGGPEAGIFFTRWVTHFCAPAFVFLTGTSAYLYGLKLGDTYKLSRYLLTRGFMLIVLEFTLIRFCWTFNLNFNEFILAGVIWMLGVCMMILGLMLRLNTRTIGVIGLTIIFFQQAFAFVPLLVPENSRAWFGKIWEFIYSSGLEGPSGITILYVIVPWIGVMAAGFAFGTVLELELNLRRKILIRIGAIASLAFVVVGSIVIFTSAPRENNLPFLFELLNQRKYPASQLFLLMTLGPSILLMPFVERAQNGFSKAIIIFGRVPLFYYLMHIPVIHITSVIVNLLREGVTHGDWYATAPYVWYQGEPWPLSLLYLVFIVDVSLLYFLCRWYERYKFMHPEKAWLQWI